MEYWRKVFRQRFAELKASEDLTQAKLAEMLGVSQGTVGGYHTGNRTPRNIDQFRKLEKALKLPIGSLTKPSPEEEELQSLQMVAESATPYKSSINQEAIKSAVNFVMDELGYEGMKKQGAAWVAETIVMLYDLFNDPASENLNRTTILKMVSTLHR